jgi:hypothetical protein
VRASEQGQSAPESEAEAGIAEADAIFSHPREPGGHDTAHAPGGHDTAHAPGGHDAAHAPTAGGEEGHH